MTTHPSLELTILMPCLNEEKTVGLCVDEALTYLHTSGCMGEVLVCDNGSTDDSAAIAAAHGARVVFCPERGYGHALRFGLRKARGTYIIMGDSDLSYDFTAIAEMHRLLREEADVVIGNRFASPPDPQAMPAAHRIGAPLLSWAARMRYKSSVVDFHCGLRGLTRDAFRRMRLSCPGMEFATEMIAEAHKKGLRVAQTPVVLRKDGRCGPSHLRTLRDGLRHFFLILRG